MAKKYTDVLIPIGGRGEIRTMSVGFPGQECQAFSGPIIAALGGNVTSDEPTNEVVQEQAQVVLEGAA
jgi:hypothetical protein